MKNSAMAVQLVHVGSVRLSKSCSSRMNTELRNRTLSTRWRKSPSIDNSRTSFFAESRILRCRQCNCCWWDRPGERRKKQNKTKPLSEEKPHWYCWEKQNKSKQQQQQQNKEKRQGEERWELGERRRIVEDDRLRKIINKNDEGGIRRRAGFNKDWIKWKTHVSTGKAKLSLRDN